MSLAEVTKSMIDVLPESDVKVIYFVAKNMFDKESSPFKALTREQILGDLAISRRQVENGECDDFDEFMDKIGADYGI